MLAISIAEEDNEGEEEVHEVVGIIESFSILVYHVGLKCNRLTVDG